MAFSKYNFILDKNNKEGARIYSGTLLSPMQGFKLGMKVAKMIAKVIDNAVISDELNDLLSDEILEDPDNISNDPEMIRKGIRLIVKCLEYIDIEEYMLLVNEVLEDTPIFAKVDKGGLANKEDLVLLKDTSSINKWFGQYPQDLLFFSANILFKNSSPFLPVGLKTNMPQLLKPTT